MAYHYFKVAGLKLGLFLSAQDGTAGASQVTMDRGEEQAHRMPEERPR